MSLGETNMYRRKDYEDCSATPNFTPGQLALLENNAIVWDQLSPSQRANFLNVTSSLEHNGFSYAGLLLQGGAVGLGP
jgi:hypothetical protein